VRDHQAEPLGDRGDVLADQNAFRRVGIERDQHAIEADMLVRLGDGLDMAGIDGAGGAAHRLRGVEVTDIADEFDAHVIFPCS
jgi:hypothetical protein